MGSSFQINITLLVHAGDNTIEIEVSKPGTRYPVRQALAGFLPDVATTYVGIWQGIRLHQFLSANMRDVRFGCTPNGSLSVVGTLDDFSDSGPWHGVRETSIPSTKVASAQILITPELRFKAAAKTPCIKAWSPEQSDAFYTATLKLYSGESAVPAVQVTRRPGVGVERRTYLPYPNFQYGARLNQKGSRTWL